MEPAKFRQHILSWYKAHGRKNLPWQHNITPYKTWVSEIMLQQTQVTTVIPYFERFIQRFPTIKTLAEAELDEVLHLWTGLGYYARARNLHRAANIIQTRFAGKFPEDLATVMSLPGVGRSTAGAILSLALLQPHAILDGNVKRVLSRFHGIDGWYGLRPIEEKLWQIANSYIAKKHPAEYTQAMMDLGAIICVRKNPLCQHCPLISSCVAYQSGRQHELPTPKPKKTLPHRKRWFLILHNQEGSILLEQRPPSGIWGGLWSFPECEPGEDLDAYCKKNWGCRIQNISFADEIIHTFSHFKLYITPVNIAVKSQAKVAMDSKKNIWQPLTKPCNLGLATPIKQLLEYL